MPTRPPSAMRCWRVCNAAGRERAKGRAGQLQRVLDRMGCGAWPWTLRAYVAFAFVAPLLALAITQPRFYPQTSLAGVAYVAAALLFVATQNDWVRFTISGVHFIFSGLVLYGIVFILPDRTPDALFPLRAILIFGATLVTTALLWHADTGRWVHGGRLQGKHRELR